MAGVVTNDSSGGGAVDEHPVANSAAVTTIMKTLSDMNQVILLFHEDAGGVDHHVGLVRSFGYFARDDERAEFLDAIDSFETFLQRFPGFVNSLHGDD